MCYPSNGSLKWFLWPHLFSLCADENQIFDFSGFLFILRSKIANFCSWICYDCKNWLKRNRDCDFASIEYGCTKCGACWLRCLQTQYDEGYPALILSKTSGVNLRVFIFCFSNQFGPRTSKGWNRFSVSFYQLLRVLDTTFPLFLCFYHAGLTLTAANIVIFAEINFVPSQLLQCEDRVHRMSNYM